MLGVERLLDLLENVFLRALLRAQKKRVEGFMASGFTISGIWGFEALGA